MVNKWDVEVEGCNDDVLYRSSTLLIIIIRHYYLLFEDQQVVSLATSTLHLSPVECYL